MSYTPMAKELWIPDVVRTMGLLVVSMKDEMAARNPLSSSNTTSTCQVKGQGSNVIEDLLISLSVYMQISSINAVL